MQLVKLGVDLNRKKYVVGVCIHNREIFLVRGAYEDTKELEAGYREIIKDSMENQRNVPRVFERKGDDISELPQTENGVSGLVRRILTEEYESKHNNF